LFSANTFVKSIIPVSILQIQYSQNSFINFIEQDKLRIMKIGLCLTCHKKIEEPLIDSCIKNDHEIIVLQNDQVVFAPNVIHYQEFPTFYLTKFLNLIPVDEFELRHTLREFILKYVDREYNMFVRRVIENHGP